MQEHSVDLKILQFCNKPPYPPKDGGAIGMHNVSQSYIDRGYDLQILSVNSEKHNVDIHSLPKEYLNTTNFEAVKLDLSVNIWTAFVNLFYTQKSYNISRFFSKKMDDKLSDILKSNTFDVIQIESIFLKEYLPTIRKYSKAKVVLRAPNVEFIIWQRLAEIEKSFLKRFYLNILAKRLKAEEIETFKMVDAIYTVTERDMTIIQSFGVKVPITFVPTGIDVTKDINTSEIDVDYPSLFHLGALDWMPNQEAIKWLLDNVWPEVHKRIPELKFYIAGRRPPKWLLDINVDGVVVVGEVDDAAKFIKSKAIMPVPLFSGSGMRVKIIEAMMLKKAVVSTTIGIEGIIHKDNENVLIADTAEEFVKSIILLASDKMEYQKICNNAKANVERYYSNDIITKKLSEFIEKIL